EGERSSGGVERRRKRKVEERGGDEEEEVGKVGTKNWGSTLRRWPGGSGVDGGRELEALLAGSVGGTQVEEEGEGEKKVVKEEVDRQIEAEEEKESVAAKDGRDVEGRAETIVKAEETTVRKTEEGAVVFKKRKRKV
ncbi:hypothetical protein P152DRAFT_472106, partial [Eremomyces bilateralis CBS 781.70]